ncbi:hypothetical protein Bcp1_215 [Bacillus phage Bcp1]|uniref:Uncharacterized protein n=1 Tax=Bacillus phage Bcp1 TaxID=584892 RepID=X2JLG8_9CAUD|nr:hypothetical protein Bcp1_215 [Bacillus phage Bcp1]AHN66690.1 hypothetical protein Bcp1_215 [Bacillus phage Bcp1]
MVNQNVENGVYEITKLLADAKAGK